MPFNAERRVSSYPRITGDTFRAFCNHIIDETQIPFDPQKVLPGDTVFVNGNLLEQFFETIYPKIVVPFVLVSHNSTRMVPDTLSQHLNDEKIIAWFTRNPDRIGHPKLFGLPLGLGNAYFPFGSKEIGNRVIKQQNRFFTSKKNLLYLGFNPRTNHKERWPALRLFKNAPYAYHPTRRVSYEQHLINLGESTFVISPQGAGLDCYRHWEAMLMGCIPIIKHSTLDPLFDDLPVVLIHDWSEVTQQLLQQKIIEMSNKTYNLAKLYADYWFNTIKEQQAKV